MSNLVSEFINNYCLNLDKVVDVLVTRYLLVVCVIILISYWLFGKKTNGPPGPIGLPVLGYLPFLTSEPYKGLHKLSDKYGSVFGLYMGRTYVVILADYSAVQEAFSKSTTTDRPESVFDFIPDGVGFSSVNGEEWTEQRRYCVRAMRNLGLGKDSWENLVQAEVEDFIQLISTHEGKPFNVNSFFTASVSNNISTLVFGKRISLDDTMRRFLNESIDASSQFATQFGLRSSFPVLYDAVAGLLGFGESNVYLKKLVEFNQFVRDQVEEHKKLDVKENEDDFINGYLLKIKENKERNLGNTFNETNLYGNIQALFIGATDTTRNSLNWLLVAMAAHPDTQSRIQGELDRVLGPEGRIRWSERGTLPYTYATIMEGQRWKTIAPLNTARIAMEDMTLGGYDIAKGTTIIANNWGMHHDTKYWKDPEQFQPERFLSPDGKQVNFKPESYVAFSYGKRNCPGETVAMMEILFYFVAILQKFHVFPPEGQKPKLEGTLGLTYQVVPQDLRFINRI